MPDALDLGHGFLHLLRAESAFPPSRGNGTVERLSAPQRLRCWKRYCGASINVRFTMSDLPEPRASTSLLPGQLWRRQLDQRDADLPRDVEDSLVAVELAVDDAFHAGVGHHLEAVPARAGRGVAIGAFDAHAVSRRLQHGVGLGVDGR